MSIHSMLSYTYIQDRRSKNNGALHMCLSMASDFGLKRLNL